MVVLIRAAFPLSDAGILLWMSEASSQQYEAPRFNLPVHVLGGLSPVYQVLLRWPPGLTMLHMTISSEFTLSFLVSRNHASAHW